MKSKNHIPSQEIESIIKDLDDNTARRMAEDSISLDEPVDEASLETFWNEVVDDIHEDPQWFNFS